MNRDRFGGICLQFNGVLKQGWGALSHNPRIAAEGARVRLAGRNQELRALSKLAADRQMADFMNRNRNWMDLSKH